MSIIYGFRKYVGKWARSEIQWFQKYHWFCDWIKWMFSWNIWDLICALKKFKFLKLALKLETGATIYCSAGHINCGVVEIKCYWKQTEMNLTSHTINRVCPSQLHNYWG